MGDKMKAILVKDGKGPIENLYIGETDMPRATSEGQVVVKVSDNRAGVIPRSMEGLTPLANRSKCLA